MNGCYELKSIASDGNAFFDKKPLWSYTGSMESEYLTAEKKVALEAELVELKSTKRQEIIDRVSHAKSLGDLSENAEYHQARDDQRKNEERIQHIETILKSAIVIEKSDSGVIELSSCVTVQRESADPQEFCLVGVEEADMATGKLSFKSPLGEALFGKKKGDVVAISTPKGEVRYTIIDIK